MSSSFRPRTGLAPYRCPWPRASSWTGSEAPVAFKRFLTFLAFPWPEGLRCRCREPPELLNDDETQATLVDELGRYAAASACGDGLAPSKRRPEALRASAAGLLQSQLQDRQRVLREGMRETIFVDGDLDGLHRWTHLGVASERMGCLQVRMVQLPNFNATG
jgi:hypothetical protein